MCTNYSAKESTAALSKFYYYAVRLNQAATAAVQQDILITKLLSQKQLPTCPSEDVLNSAHKVCQQMLQCGPGTSGSLDQLVQAISDDYPVYFELLDKIKKLPADCEKGLECKKTKEAYRLGVVGLSERNPWFLDEDFRHASRRPIKERLVTYLKESQESLKQQQKKISLAAECIHGKKMGEVCDMDDMRETLANTPPVRMKEGISKDQNLTVRLMGVESCIEDWSLEKNRTAGVITNAMWDAGAVVGTLGYGAIAFLFDAYSVANSLKGAVAACGPAQVDLGKTPSSKDICNNQGLLTSSSYQHGSCLTQAALSAVGLGAAGLSAQRLGKVLTKESEAKTAVSASASAIERRASEMEASTPAASSATSSTVPRATSTLGQAEDAVGGGTKVKTKTQTQASTAVHIADASVDKRDLVQAYAQKKLTTTSENEGWKSFISNARESLRTMVVENSVLKTLNDKIIKDEEYVTALMNLAGSMQIKKYKELEEKIRKRYPNFKFHLFSDFKSVKVAYDDVPGFNLNGKSIEDLLKETADQTNKDFAKYLLEHKLVRESDNPQSWYKAALDASDDWTGLKAKYARDSGSTDSMFLSAQKEKDFKAWANKEFSEAKNLRTEILSSFKDTAVIVGKNTGEANIDLGVFAILRKNKDNPELAKSLIESEYGLQSLSPENFNKLQSFFKKADTMSPGLQGTERTFATLADAPHGGISIDMIDLGAEHIQATSSVAFGKAKNIEDYLATARKAEQDLTEQIAKRKEQIEQKFRDITGDPNAVVQCSGDGCKAFLKNRELTDTEAKRFADIVTQGGEQGKLRFSAIQKLESAEYADVIAKQGEDLEKALRIKLRGSMDIKRLKGLNFSVSIKAPKPGEGSAQLHVSESSGLKLSPQERKQIEDAYKNALKESGMGYKN